MTYQKVLRPLCSLIPVQYQTLSPPAGIKPVISYSLRGRLFCDHDIWAIYAMYVQLKYEKVNIVMISWVI